MNRLMKGFVVEMAWPEKVRLDVVGGEWAEKNVERREKKY